MRFFVFLILLSQSFDVFGRQGVFIPPAKKTHEAPRIVRMVLGDNQKAPVVDIGVQGPTVAIFPGDVSYCNNTSSIFGWKKGGTAQVKNEQWFREIVFFLKAPPESLNTDQQKLLYNKPVSLVCRLELSDSFIYREVLLRLNPAQHRAVVFFDHPHKTYAQRYEKASSFDGFKYIELKDGKPSYKTAGDKAKAYDVSFFEREGYKVFKGAKHDAS